MELWFSESHTKGVKLSIVVDKQLYSGQSKFQRIDVFSSPEFGRFLTLDGYMMLTEKAAALGRNAHLYLVHYPVETYGEYDPSKVLVMPVSFKGDYAAQIEKGLGFISDTIASGWVYTPKDVMATSDLPAEIAGKVEYIKERLKLADAIKAETEAFKETLLGLCLKHGVKSIVGDGWSASVREGYTSQRVDSKKLQAQHPDIYKECLTTTNNKPSITIKVK